MRSRIFIIVLVACAFPTALFANDMSGIVYILAAALGDAPLLLLTVASIVFSAVAGRRSAVSKSVRWINLFFLVTVSAGSLLMLAFHLLTSFTGDERMRGAGIYFLRIFLPILAAAIISVMMNINLHKKNKREKTER